MLAIALVAAAPSAVALADNGSRDNDSRHDRSYDHIFVLVDENTEFSSVIGNTIQFPTINALVITFDEGDSDLGCCDGGDDPTTTGGGKVVTVIIRNHQDHPLQDPTPYNHHSLVAPLQEAFGLGCTFNGQPVGDTCDRQFGVQPMEPLFGLR